MNQKQLIILISADEVGSKMAGPGIRYSEFAKVLAKDFKVLLFTPNKSDLISKEFETISYNHHMLAKEVAPYLNQSPVIIAQNLGSKLLNKVRKSRAKFIYDLYDPNIVEILEYAKGEPEKKQEQLFNYNWATFLMHLSIADHLICASNRQRDFYIGILSKLGLVTPNLYLASADLSKLISIVPFGISNANPKATKNNYIEEKFPSIKSSDKIVYWGGGVWNWFDAISVVKAMKIISQKRSDIKLIFAGIKHPNSKIKTMSMAEKVLEYCRNNDLVDKYVFINNDWTPFNERANYLTRASVGISTHFDNLETRLSFRTRILDYLWADLPIVSTRGDYFADLVEQHQLGLAINYQDVEAIAQAIEKLIDDKKLNVNCQDSIGRFKNTFYWQNCLSPVVKLINENGFIQLPKSTLPFYLSVLRYLFAGFKKKYF